MDQQRNEALQRIGHWREVLIRELEQAPVQHEKHRIERELAELQQAQDDTEHMNDEQLRQLSERLARNPEDWVEHHLR